MSKSGRSTQKFYTAHFKQGRKVGNNSGRYFWKCNYCGDDAPEREGRETKLFKHILSHDECPNAPAHARVDARLQLIAKGNIPVQSGSLFNAGSVDSPLSSGAEDHPESSLAVSKKRKKQGTLEGFVDHALNESQQQSANLKFLRYVIILNLLIILIN